MKWYLVLVSIVWVLAGVASIMPLLLSPMLFDAPGSMQNPATITLFFAVVTFPVCCLLAIAVAWALYAAEKSRPAAFVTLLPLLNVLVGAGAILWLELAYNGNLGG